VRDGVRLPPGYFLDVGGRVESQGRAAHALVILATLPTAFAGGIVALLVAGETWNVCSLVSLIGLFGIAVQNGLVLVTQARALVAKAGRSRRRCARRASAAFARSS
jgi:cobalt-zinc-cadmium resistance protein CzcA